MGCGVTVHGREPRNVWKSQNRDGFDSFDESDLNLQRHESDWDQDQDQDQDWRTKSMNQGSDSEF